MKLFRATAWLALRIGVALLLYAFLFNSLEWEVLREQLLNASLPWFAATILVICAGIWLSAWRWQLALGILAVRRSFRELLLRYWSGTFYNNVLPGSIGGDVVRIAGLTRSGVAFGISAQSVLADRLIGLWAGLLLGLLACLWPSQAPYRLELGLLFAASVTAGVLAVWLLPRLSRYVPARFTRFVALADQFHDRRWLHVTGLALVFQVLVVLTLYFAALTLRTPIPLVAAGIYAPAVVLITLVPISLNGLGLREVSLVALLAGVGVTAESATLIGIVNYVAVIIGSLPGGISGLFVGAEARQTAEVSHRP